MFSTIQKQKKSIGLKQLFSPETFRNQGYRVVDMLATYLEETSNRSMKTVLPNLTPDQMVNTWSGEFLTEPTETLDTILSKTIALSNHLHHPKYMGHQVTSPLPVAALCDLVGSFLNNATAIYEMGPVTTALEKHLVTWMCEKVGYDQQAGGFFTSGGTLGNLTALLAARQAKVGENCWKNGLANDTQYAVLVSEQCHYSAKRALQVMGFGEEGVILLPTDENYAVKIESLEEKYFEALKQGKKVFAVVGNGCSTATGTYDDIDALADFCEKFNLWLHVDGAHGASALLSDTHRHLLNGIHRADSFIWDAHKMMLMPTLITAVLFKDGNHSFEIFLQKASYLFEKEAKEEWYNLSHRTMECSKTMMALKLYASLKTLGTQVFSDYIDYVYGLTSRFADILEKEPDFEIAMRPQSNIICFRYTGKPVSNVDQLQKDIRKKILQDESFYIVQTDLRGKTYLRCTLINPQTTEQDLLELLSTIRTFA